MPIFCGHSHSLSAFKAIDLHFSRNKGPLTSKTS